MQIPVGTIASGTLHATAPAILALTMKVSVVVVVAAMVTSCMRRCSAAARHLVWCIALGAVVALPVLATLLPVWNMPYAAWPAAVDTRVTYDATGEMPSPVSAAAAQETAASSGIERGEPGTLTLTNRHVAPPASPVRANRPIDAVALLLVLWLAGTLLSLGGILRAVRVLARVRRRAVPARGAGWRLALQRAQRARSSGTHRWVSLLLSDDVDVPLTWGVLRPVILLPRDAEGWSDERLVLVLRHELAHVARHDVASQLTACVARALYWPNPLVWYAERALRRECEQACDDAVLAAGTRPTRYAEELLDIARTVTEGRVAALAPSFASAAPIERRVRALLDARVRRRPTTRMHAMTGAFASLGIVVPLAAMSPVPQARPSIAATLPAAAAAPVRDTSALSIRMPTREAARGRAPALATPSLRTLPIRREERAELCPSDGRSSHTNMTSERSGWKTWDVRWSGRDCSVELRAEGEITFNDDFTDVMRISRGGSFDLAVRQGDALTRLVMTPTGDGGLARRFTVNGAEREWNSEARAWLAGFLLQLDRQTGFAIEARFPKLLAQGGVRAVLEEIALLQGDYVRGLYFQKLIADAKLDPSQVRQVLDLAGGNVKSDYELARVLVAIADRYGLPDEPTRSAFLRAVNTISSDYERNRTLQTLLGRSDLSAGEAAAVLQSASALHSDYELARTLVAMASKRLVTPALRGAYLDDAAKLSSDYERSRTLLALLDTGKLDPADVTRVIALAGAMNSDYERARVLVNIAGSYELDAKTRDAYLKAADDIKSDYERGRTLSALRGRQR